jgi:Protein of unknown function, DUF488
VHRGARGAAWPPRGLTLELFTSSYRAWRPGAGSPVSTSLTTPKWWPEAAEYPQLWEACPRWSYFCAEPAEFERAYLAQLERYGPQRIARRLAEIARNAYMEPSDRLCLLCFEADPADCHRSLFASWLLTTTGEKVTEIT